MVFTQLSDSDKSAFFDILDEYFASRPEIFGGAASNSTNEREYSSNPAANQAASAVHRALAANPEATANLITAGLRQGASSYNAQAGGTSGSRYAGDQRSREGNGSNTFANINATSNSDVSNALGRVAAASLTFSAPKSSTPRASPGAPPMPPTPPVLPRRTSTNSVSPQRSPSPPLPPPTHAPSMHTKPSGQTSGLVTGKSFGNIDTSSFAKGVMSYGKSKPKTTNAHVPAAFTKPPNSFAPPPVRRVSISPPDSEPEQEEDSNGTEDGREWAEALYDYNSGESGDLSLYAKEKVRIVSKDSDDWWTGELRGKTGLFPASYVKLL